jgi:23S rRNA pseudouridine2605 synthase
MNNRRNDSGRNSGKKPGGFNKNSGARRDGAPSGRQARPYSDRNEARPRRDDRSDAPRSERPARPYSDRNEARPRRDDRSDAPRSERPARPFSDRNEARPRRDDRSDAPRGERPARPYSDRNEARPRRDDKRDAPRGERPARPFSDRDEARPRRDDRRDAPRGERPARPFSDRDEARPRRDERRDAPRGERPERPFSDRDEARPRRDERRDAPRGERPARPYSNRDEARPRRDDRSDGTGEHRPFRPYKESKEGKLALSGKHKSFGKKASRSGSGSKETHGPVRLNKFLAQAGICSRREADELIKTGLVSVNGEIVTEMGHKVLPTDIVKYNGETIKGEKPVYLLLNKPKGFITTTDDPKARKTVMDLVGNACRERIYPVGRLDRGTTGVLMFTNDGDMAKKLTHPSHGARKIYLVGLDRKLEEKDMSAIKRGLTLDDGPVQVDKIHYVEDKDKHHIGIELHVGRNRIVRRIFEQLGYEVTKLDRVSFAGLTKKNLARGQWRFLNAKEVQFLKML